MAPAVVGATGVASAALDSERDGAGRSVRRASSPTSCSTWSRVRGPRRKDIAHLVVNSTGAFSLTSWSTNWRLASPDTMVSIVFMSVPPVADCRASRIRALSRSVWSRPMHQVPALDIAL
jgi:hypothetical protein